MKAETIIAIDDLSKQISNINSEIASTKQSLAERDTKKSNSEIPKENYSTKCSFCEFSCGKMFELENHMENAHSEVTKFQCEECKKTFQLEWRLKKHKRMHTLRSVKVCKYFSSNRNCPYEKLGCKFLHKVQTVPHKIENTCVESTAQLKASRSICMNCDDQLQCGNCIVRQWNSKR